MEAAADRLSARIPGPVRLVCERLQTAGHQAVTVGGAVRDALMDRDPGDWDVATSALPDAVMKLFRRTIATGIEHGTVTVMLGKGGERQAIEVTTFRGEGAYSDARRPDQVRFDVSLEEDLARRDFVVNAMAWDPISGQLIDPFGGAEDLVARRIRAVGRAEERFAEDGLRIVRAIRFVAVLDFELEEATRAAIPSALDSLARVSRERVRVELVKLLGGVAAAHALEVAEQTGILDLVLPELQGCDHQAARARVGGCEADALVRTAALLFEVEPRAVDAALRRLTFSNADRQHVVVLVEQGAQLAGELAIGEVGAPRLRRALAAVGRHRAGELGQLVPPLADGLRRIADNCDPLTAGELALSGKDVMRILDCQPGPAVGQALSYLLEKVLDDPSRNEPKVLADILLHDWAPRP